MKKVLALLLASIMCAAMLTGCGKSSEVKAVDELISNIGTVTINSESAIKDAEEAYNELSENDKNKVSNYNTLLSARSDYDAIPKDIALTVDNIRDYFQFNLSYGDYDTGSVLGRLDFTSADVYLDVYPTVSGALSNVNVTVEITCPNMWEVTSSDSAYNASDSSKMVLNIHLPANGEYSTTHNIRRLLWTRAPESNCWLKITSVSGTFTPN